MAEILEFRWHGRGGQGTVTAAKLFAEAALAEEKFIQAFPEYGPERAGAPLAAYNRVSDEPIYVHCAVKAPGYVMVVDPSLLTGGVDVTKGAHKDALYLVNTVKSPKEVRETMGIAGGKIFTVDATGISRDELGRPLPNTPMLGALSKVSGQVSVETVTGAIKRRLGKKFSEKVVTANLKMVQRGYEEVKGE
ncbi:MAG TPA: 2-oxoacid:acceptor oxidoreductase family protein [bacterium]|nr:2-oxoacid:acceptor oxidoreductase family protein [bacterium]